jgi:hypothetical protein
MPAAARSLTLAISPEKVCFVALKAREFDVKDAVSDPDSGSNPTDDAMLDVLEDQVSRTPQNDERYADPAFAIGDAFKRARRQLQDKVRHMQGQVKEPERAPVGTITKIDSERGFGFLESADGAGNLLSRE